MITMRIEGISGGSAPPLTGHAHDQHVPARTAVARRSSGGSHPAAPAPEPNTPAVVVDVRASSSAATSHQAAAYSAPPATMAAATAPRPAHIDRDGDGWINLNDLPFDYFQILRRTNMKQMSQMPQAVPHEMAG
jgi:hypothetical protein